MVYVVSHACDYNALSDTTSVRTMALAIERGTVMTLPTLDGDRLQRVTRANAHTITVRDLHKHRAVEWLRAQYENWVQWPMRDAVVYMRRFLANP